MNLNSKKILSSRKSKKIRRPDLEHTSVMQIWMKMKEKTRNRVLGGMFVPGQKCRSRVNDRQP